MSRQIMQQALAALKEYDALIKHSYTGSRDAISDLQYATFNGRDSIEALEAELAKQEKCFCENIQRCTIFDRCMKHEKN
jgi:hypothetical protein